MSSNLVQIIKQIASEAVEASRPVKILFGEVLSISPLEILVEQKKRLTSEFFILCREVTDYDVEMTVNHMTEKMQGGGKDPSFTSHAHQYKGRKVFTVHKALQVGEVVLLIQMQGGQKYIVVDRVIQ